MDRIRVVIVEDQQLARDHLASMLQDEPDVEIAAACETGRAAVDAVRGLRPDVVFLDLEMPDIDGFGIIEAIGADRMPITIVVTAHEDGAVRAFELRAFDYLLKPFGRERLQHALARARDQLAAARDHDLTHRLLALAGEAQSVGSSPTRFVVRSGGRVFFVPVPEIKWIESNGNYVRLHTTGRTHVVRETMASLGQRLDGYRFSRIHRTRLVNLDRVRELRSRGNGEYDVVMDDGTELRVGRAFRQELHRKLQTG